MTDERELRLPLQVYRLRVLGLALGFLSVGTVFYARHAALWAWAALAFHGFLWPHVAWYHSRTSADPHRAERTNLLVDSALGGAWVALMNFSLLPSVLLVAMLSMDKIGWGLPFLARSTALMAVTCAITTVFGHATLQPDTTMAMIVGSLPLMVAYPFAVALVSERSGRLARERKKAVEQAAALREQLAHMGRLGTLGEMAAGLAHELNQPLTSIHLEANVALTLDAQAGAAELRDSLMRISDQSLRAGDIVRRMRIFARRREPRQEATAMDELIREVLALLDHDLRLAGVGTTVEAARGLLPALIDRVEIQQVLINLIRNAIEAMTDVAERHLTIRTTMAHGRVRVSVSDTGRGIDPVILERLFHPFQSTKPTGLGLGLSICQSLVEANGGRVGAAPSAESGGATFFFELPTAPVTPGV